MDTETSENTEEIVDFRRPWDIRPDETHVQFRRFVAYRELPPHRRSIANAYNSTNLSEQPSNRIGTSWRDDFRRFDWENRATAYDIHRDQQRQKIVEEYESDTTRDLCKHIHEFKKLELACGMKALHKANQIFLMPLITEEVKELREGKTIIYQQTPAPPALLLAAAALMDKGSKIGRKALGLRDDDTGNPVSIDEYKKQMFRTASEAEAAMPAGAAQPVPTQTAVKPEFHTAGTMLSGNGNGDSATTAVVPLKGARLRP
jgi:hypothetical protein